MLVRRRAQPLSGERLPALRDWFQNHWRKRMTDTIIVRYADDFVCGFQYQGDAKRWDLGERLAHLNCTRTIIEFGRFARANRRKRGQDVRLPRYDALLRADEEGQVQGWPQTIPETGTLRRIKEALRKRWHDNRHKTAKWRVIKGCYYAVPGSSESLQGFIYQCKRLRALRRRSQKDRTEWRDMDTFIEAYWPKASIRGQTSALSSGEEPDANSASPDLCGGTGETRFPTAIALPPRSPAARNGVLGPLPALADHASPSSLAPAPRGW